VSCRSSRAETSVAPFVRHSRRNWTVFETAAHIPHYFAPRPATSKSGTICTSLSVIRFPCSAEHCRTDRLRKFRFVRASEHSSEPLGRDLVAPGSRKPPSSGKRLRAV
jgi:hypothetical protein